MSASATIDFYFDYSSPYAYLASHTIEALAQKHGRTVTWRPILLGFVFKTTDSKPLVHIPLKGDYSMHDLKRTARETGVPFVIPDNFPIGTVAAARATLWVRANHADKTDALVHALFNAYFGNNTDISDAANVLQIAGTCGIDASALEQALGDNDVKALLKTEVDNALNAGVFGAPFMVVDGEPFWGHDRLPVIDRWLSTGGW